MNSVMKIFAISRLRVFFDSYCRLDLITIRFLSVIFCLPMLSAATLSPNISSISFDWTSILGFISAGLAAIAAILSVRNEALKAKLSKLTIEVDSLRKFASSTYSTSFVATDLFVLGPRAHGKTSIVTSLTRQWLSIEGMPPTPLEFQHFVWRSPNYTETSIEDSDLNLKRFLKTHAELNIYDYAGEEHVISAALSKLSKSEKFMVIFVMSCEDNPAFQSDSYFNISTLNAMRKAISQSKRKACAVVTLFSKQDASSYSSHIDPCVIPSEIIDKNMNALINIETIFGDTTKFVVSSQTGFGLSHAFRFLLGNVVDKDGIAFK